MIYFSVTRLYTPPTPSHGAVCSFSDIADAIDAIVGPMRQHALWSLASFSNYFRYTAQQGHQLFIEEPELGLPPSAQCKFTQVLGMMLNRGLKVTLTTHSDYVIRELNHLIRLSQAKHKAERLGYSEQWLIHPDQLGNLRLLDEWMDRVLPTETGFEVRSIDEEIKRMNRVTQEIEWEE